MNIVVVGAGIAGLATALELRKATCSVRVFAGTDTATQASWAAGGLLMPIPPWAQSSAIETLAERCVRAYPAWLQDIQTRTGLVIEYRRSGALFFDLEHEAIAAEWAQRQGRRLEILSLAEVTRHEPQARSAAAMHLADVTQVRNPGLLKALRASLASLGVLIEATPVTGIASEGGWLRGVRTPQGLYAADAVVVAAGAWTPEIESELTWPPIAPMRGQMLLYRLPAAACPKACLLGQGHYVIPRADGHLVCGSTVEAVGFDRGTTPEVQARLREAAGWLCPALIALSPVAHWSGLRPGSADGLPYIGAHPELAGVYVNSGHFRNGVLFAPIAARLVTDLILDRPATVDPEPFKLVGRRGMGV